MVETRTHSTSRSFSASTAARTGAQHRRAEVDPANFPPNLRVESSDSSARTGRRSARRARSRGLRLYGESATLATVVACFTLICVLGVTYLGAYAYVAMQARQLHTLQSEASAAKAENEVLIAQCTALAYGKRVLSLASQQGMVAAGAPEYITLTSGSQDGDRSSQVASAR